MAPWASQLQLETILFVIVLPEEPRQVQPLLLSQLLYQGDFANVSTTVGKILVVSYFVELGVCRIHFSGESIFPAVLAGQEVFNKDPTVWLDGAGPTPIKSNYVFGKVKI